MNALRRMMMGSKIKVVAATLTVVGAIGAIGGTVTNQDVTILTTTGQWRDPTRTPGGTIWRYFETWQTDVVRTDKGELVPVDPDRHVAMVEGGSPKSGPFRIVPAKVVEGSAFPARGWQGADFDDGDWLRLPGPFLSFYRSLALSCIRGKFEVRDPGQVSNLTLTVDFQGGALAYVNGTEIGRAGLPAGRIEPQTLAEDYPEATDEGANEKEHFGLINQIVPNSQGYFVQLLGKDDGPRVWGKDQTNYLQRFRSLQAPIPSSLLRKGVNVLAIEVHRAPAHARMFTALGGETAIMRLPYLGWNRCMIDNVVLTAHSNSAAIVSNVARPAGVQVWNASALSRVVPMLYGDPNEALRPIQLVGLKNGVYSGQIIVSAPETIKGFQATVTDLADGAGNRIPASQILIGYPTWDCPGPDYGHHYFNTLEPLAPTEIKGGVFAYNDKKGFYANAFQPIWLSVKVPSRAGAGRYAGALTVHADGMKAVAVPIQLRVVGDWAIPDPKDFTVFMGAIESPESVALKYGVPFWSEAHWRHLDKVFELLGQTGVKDLHIPITAKNHLGNEQSMVRWIKQPDGSYKRDYQIAEKYLDLARKHLNLRVVAFWPSSYVACRDPKAERRPPCFVTQFDPVAGTVADVRAPDWGTPEALAFWQPAIAELRALLAKRGMEKTMLFGGAPEGSPGGQLYNDLRTLAPDIRWYRRNHMSWSFTMGDRDTRQEAGYVSQAHGGVFHSVAGLQFNVRNGGKWKVPAGGILTSTPWDMTPESELPIYRICAEGTRHSADGWQGISNLGADYWQVLRERGYQNAHGTLLGRYVAQGWIDCTYNPAILGAGKEGPVPTCRYQLMREAFQEAEAVIFVQRALDDPAQRAKLKPALVKRCESVCAERDLLFDHYARYLTHFYSYGFSVNYDRFFDEAALRKNSEQIDELAGEIARALGKQRSDQ